MIRASLSFGLAAAVAFAGQSDRKQVTIRDWSILLPAEVNVTKTEGPDFSVTYFQIPRLRSEFGIYQGGHPTAFHKKGIKSTEEKDRIGSQDVVWVLWKEVSDGSELYWAELYMVSAVTRMTGLGEELERRLAESGAKLHYEEKFHIFISAPDVKSRTSVQEIVRTLKKAPNKSPEPTPTAVTPRATETKPK